VLNHPQVSQGHSVRRSRRYDERVEQALISLWKAANQICAKRLVPFLPELVSSMERHGHLSLPEDVRERLLTISPATADRLLARERSPTQRGQSMTRPGSLLKKQIRVRTFTDWDDLQPGFVEADLVAHCGETTEGSFLHTLVLVDVATGWTECLALLRRSEADVIGALNSVRQRLPVALLGLDTDNGSEFINYEMLRYCQREFHGPGGPVRILLRKFGQRSGCGLRSTRLRRLRHSLWTCSAATPDAFTRDSCALYRGGFAIGEGSSSTVRRCIVLSRLLAWPEWNRSMAPENPLKR